MRNQQSGRNRRIADQIGREIAMIILSELDDERVQGITVSGVDVTRDRRDAIVHISLPSEVDVEETMKVLRRASSLIRKHLAKRVRMKFVPTLRFEHDPSLDNVDNIERLLREALKSDR